MRERVLCEVEEHLRKAAAFEQEHGASPAAAERTAIHRFGPVDDLARTWNELYAGETFAIDPAHDEAARGEG